MEAYKRRQTIQAMLKDTGEVEIDGDAAQLESQLLRLAKQVVALVDHVIEYQIDAEAGNVIMDTFQLAGIPVIAVDIPLPGATFFGADNYRAGRMAGEALGYWIRQHWDGRLDRVLKLESRRVGSLANARLQGQLEGLAAVLGPIPAERVMEVDSPTIQAEAVKAIAGLLPGISTDERVAIIAINDDPLSTCATRSSPGKMSTISTRSTFMLDPASSTCHLHATWR